ncbi:hypothetical protein [Bradyrhizobium sp. URHC0002]
MIETQHPAIPTHLPWFITEPGQIDTLTVFTGLFLLLFTVTMGVLMFRLLYLPAKIVPQEQKAKYEVVATLCLLAMFTPGNLFWIAALLVAMTDIPDFTPFLQRIAGAVRRIARSPKRKEEIPPRPEKARQQRAVMKATAQMVLVLGMLFGPAEATAASCSSYYISEITLVSPGDTEAGRVQTFVGFGASKEEAEKNALGSCSHVQLDLQTCLDSDRILGRNAPSDEANSSLHLKYRKAVKRVAGCE